MRQVGLIGFGAIGAAIVDAWPKHLGDVATLRSVLIRDQQIDDVSRRMVSSTMVTSSIDRFLSNGLDVVIEAAGHGAVSDYAQIILKAGHELYLLSAGALADDALQFRLMTAAKRSNTRIVIPAGALGGFDSLLSLRAAGLQSVKYTSRKPAHAWRGTAAEDAFSLDKLAHAQVIFSGPAREAAKRYPRNANLAAAVAIAGLGFDLTEVELIADPDAHENSGRIQAISSVGTLDLTLSGAGFAENPKSSCVTALSVIAALRDSSDWISFG
jgi:aspartate dehydrogenase